MIKVYSGLSLDAQSALKILPRALIAPPISRGDLIQDIEGGLHVIVIIDGKFDQHLAVTADEITDALSCGLKVYGASSMGALRASELRHCGMIGHGMIFEQIVATEGFRDDYLAQVFGEDAGKITKLSHTYIDFQMNIQEFERQQRITVREKKTFLRVYGGIFYAERGWPAFRAALRKEKHCNARLLEIGKEACLKIQTQKQRDAIGVLRRVRDDLKRVEAFNGMLAATKHRSVAFRRR
jgi:hypothetical protein